MLFMNEYDIHESAFRFAHHPVLGPATRFLESFANEVNAHSDGWPYWSAPVHSARQLMTIIRLAIDSERGHHNSGTKPTLTDVRKALRPIKAFMTRRGYAAGMQLPELR